jgi:D-galactarolactone cycloisomerase
VAQTIIQSVTAIPVRLPRDLSSATGTAGTPNQLSGSGAYRWSRDYPALYSIYIETALIKLTLANGIVAWGEAQAPLAPEVACTIVDRLLRPVLEGSAFDGTRAAIDRLWLSMFSTMRVRGQTGGFMMDAISGVDLALWDAAGKMNDCSVSELIGRHRTAVPAYVSGLAGDSKPDAARPFYEDGFRTFKLYYESDWSALLAQVDALHSAYGDVRVAVDALWHADPAQAAELDSRDVLWLECPLVPDDVRGHLELARTLRTPIALGESYRTCAELAPLVEAATFLQPDLGRSGITESLRIAQLGRAVVPHVSVALGPQIAAALHLAASVPNCELCEYNPRILEVANRFLREPIGLDGSRWVIPHGPGLGVEIDEAGLRDAIVDENAFVRRGRGHQ